ncbi:hypothetical protein AB7M45_007856 [Bradyrhizobium elkanii]|uniref:hypothetical protein n=1 Tax=Bradyrhizobium elkanii TaxID=29448 RepID=UPI000918ACE9|nr:hypothetical protein [Bradyrhizobium elkanii]MCW2195085.1 hypothetical protein [Bradyrhizobium elkanii]NWL67223.1 hypothetical protein [Bradyrhizobium elkanii]OIM94108.1 hypothetical protein BLN97_12610 [Bradyrhizobium elkanii]
MKVYLPPPPGWDMRGWAPMADYRLAPRLFWVRLERRWINIDGRSEWRRETTSARVLVIEGGA